MTFVGNWLQVHPSWVSSNSLPTYLRSSCLGIIFHSQNVFVKSFTVFVTDFTEIFWKNIQVRRQKVDFRNHIASHSFVRSQQVLHNILIVSAFWFPTKSLQILLNDNHAFLSVSFRSSSNCLTCISSLIWGPINISSLIFASLTFGNLFLTYSNPRPVLTIPFTEFFMWPSFMCKVGRSIFSGRTRAGMTTFFSPWRQWCSFRPQFIYMVILLVPAVPLTQERTVFCHSVSCLLEALAQVAPHCEVLASSQFIN